MRNVVYVKHFPNGKKYVGITCNFNRRMREHANPPKRKLNYPISNAVKKYPEHETEIVFWSTSYEEVLEMEVIIIQNFKDLGYELYNICIGGRSGNLGRVFSEETKRKISESKRGEKHYQWGKPLKEETKQKLRELNLGEKNPMWGKTPSDETKKKISEAISGENHPMWGKKGELSPNYGRRHSEESKAKMRENHYDNSGQNSGKSHPKEYYTTNTSRRDKFKRTCKRMGWQFENFKEILSEEVYTPPKGSPVPKYYYEFVGEDYYDEFNWASSKNRPVEYYENNYALRSDFKDYCKRNSLNMLDFEEIESGEYYHFKSGSKIKYYYYRRRVI